MIVFESGFIGLGYLMLFDPRRYADLWNRHSRKTGSEKRLSIEKMLWVRHRAAGLFLLLFGTAILYVEVKILLS
jgi:hypothetical protein